MSNPTFVAAEKKPKKLRALFNEALQILSCLGIPLDGLTDRQLEKMAMAFLAVVDVTKSEDWSAARVRVSDTLKSRDIISYINRHFREKISPGSYDDIRRKDLKLPVLSGIIVASANKASSARNDPTRGYSLSPEVLPLVQDFREPGWSALVDSFVKDKITLADRLDSKRDLVMIPVKLPDGIELAFSPGEHNYLQKAIIEQFLPRYGYSAEVLYVGDTSKKFLLYDSGKLEKLRFAALGHGELPDIIAYSESKNWLYLIEAFHSTGPISPVRLLELGELAKECSADIVYVTAFLDRNTFRKNAADIAWETEVWLADNPDHLVHFNGDKFLGPHTPPDIR